jgi:hypothetical protein
MKNHYKIIDYSELGIPSIEVYGDSFHYQDLYELVGRKQFMTIFNLKGGSKSRSQYGESVLGVIYYSFEQTQKLEESFASGIDIDLAVIRIDSPEINLSVQERCDLKYGGVKVSDIESISFLPYKNETESYDTGEKKVPNIIEIEVDCSDIDPDILYQNYVASKINSNVELILYEKEKFIGITLGINNGRIDSRILNHLGFSEDSIKTNLNIWYHLYKVKERRGTLSDKEKESFSEIQGILTIEKFYRLVKEINASGVNAKELAEITDILKKIVDSVTLFTPDILLHGDRQVYWDIDSYIHIVMRHIKDYQIGNFKEKTSFPYRAADLKTLIEKVIQRIEDEIKLYLSESQNKDFTRHGSMGIVFNEDHYNLRIDPGGRLIQFHAVGEKV